jgi:GTP-binding protein
LLLHLVEITPIDGSNPVDNFRIIEDELKKYSEGIAAKDRWVVFTKSDLMPADEAKAKAREISSQLGLTFPQYQISAITGEGTQALTFAIAQYLEALAEREEAEELDAMDGDQEEKIREEVHQHSLDRRAERLSRRRGKVEDDDSNNSDPDIQVHYEP